MSARPHLPRHHHMRGIWERMRTGRAREDVVRLLAEGSTPASTRCCSRARIALSARHPVPGSAAGLERVVATADTPAGPLSAAIALRRELVRGARHELMRLAGELRHMPDPRPRGVAMAEVLLTDPSSPLYTASAGDEIARAARGAADNMRAAQARTR